MNEQLTISTNFSLYGTLKDVLPEKLVKTQKRNFMDFGFSKISEKILRIFMLRIFATFSFLGSILGSSMALHYNMFTLFNPQSLLDRANFDAVSDGDIHQRRIVMVSQLKPFASRTILTQVWDKLNAARHAADRAGDVATRSLTKTINKKKDAGLFHYLIFLLLICLIHFLFPFAYLIPEMLAAVLHDLTAEVNRKEELKARHRQQTADLNISVKQRKTAMQLQRLHELSGADSSSASAASSADEVFRSLAGDSGDDDAEDLSDSYAADEAGVDPENDALVNEVLAAYRDQAESDSDEEPAESESSSSEQGPGNASLPFSLHEIMDMTNAFARNI